MSRLNAVDYKFVEFIPSDLDEATLYISTEYATAAHKCCCGCGHRVVTPLSPTDWALTFDGKSVSLEPSIGNWSFSCKSHYWIKKNHVKWSRTWSQTEIDRGRAYDRRAKAVFESDQWRTDAETQQAEPADVSKWGTWRRRLQAWWRR